MERSKVDRSYTLGGGACYFQLVNYIEYELVWSEEGLCGTYLDLICHKIF